MGPSRTTPQDGRNLLPKSALLRLAAALVLLAAFVAGADEIAVQLPDGTPMEMVWIPPGHFTMGSPESMYEAPHEVTITQGFYLGKYELTRRQWQAVMGTEPWSVAPQLPQGPDYPAEYLSWDSLQVFFSRLNDTVGGEPFRLPTEAEWEYACRAGTTSRWSFGDDAAELGEFAWYEGNTQAKKENYGHVVGQKRPNPWGLYDMHGNVSEWVHDWFDFGYAGFPQTDPTGPVDGYYRVLRGGGYPTWTEGTRSSFRHLGSPGYGGMSQGVRVLKGQPLNVVVPEPVEFPRLDAGPFLPIEEGNIWIYAVHSHGYGPPSVDTLIWVPESQIIDGQQYWNLGWLGGPFRIDDRGDIWYRQNAETRDVIRRFLALLDAEPLLRTAEFYQKSRIFTDLSADSADLLVVEFDGPNLEGESPTAELDQRLYGEYTWALQWALPMGIEKRGSPAPDQRAFAFICCGTEWSAWVVFQRGVGVVEMTSGSELTSGQADTKLIWARIGGREYGRHPGESYPGYPTSVERASWGQIKRYGTERPRPVGGSSGPPKGP